MWLLFKKKTERDKKKGLSLIKGAEWDKQKSLSF